MSLETENTPTRILVCGDDGIGKSTIVDHLRRCTEGLDPVEWGSQQNEAFAAYVTNFGFDGNIAVVLIDAEEGLTTSTYRQTLIAHLLGIPFIIVAVNKIDLVGYDPKVFEDIQASYQLFADGLGFQKITIIPTLAPAGDNIKRKSDHMPWHSGPTLVACLDEVVSTHAESFGRGGEGMIATDQVQAHLIWISDEPMIPGRQYDLKRGSQDATAWVSELKYAINISTTEHTAVKTLELNDIGVCNLSFDRRIACDAYADNRTTGSFVLIDRATNATVGVGLIDFSLRRAQNLTLQSLTMDKQARARAMGQKPLVIWLTGLSGSGKSTVANAVESRLFQQGHRTYLLDGDNVRHGLNRDLGFTEADRVENIRRFGEVAKLFADAGLIVLVSVISPFQGERNMVRDLLDDGEFVEVFVNASLATCEQRDPKGLYARARKGEIQNFTGIDSPYEAPLNPELVLDTDKLSPDEAADQVIAFIDAKSLKNKT
jgi:adenylyl-sulfate kinase